MNKIIVTGGLGHIGSKLITSGNHLSKYVVIDSVETQRYGSLFGARSKSIKLIEKRVQDLNAADLTFLKDANAIVHLAATTDATGTVDNPTIVRTNNLAATKSVIELARQLDLPVVFPSTTSVYGQQNSLVDEQCSDLRPQSPYAESKIEEERLLTEGGIDGLRFIIFRFGTISGPSSGMRFHTAVNKFCWQAINGQKITVWRTALNQKRPYLSLMDAENAIHWSLTQSLFPNEIFNVVTGNYSVQEILDFIEGHLKRKIEIDLVDHRIMNQLSYEVDSKKIESLGFKFRGSISEEIKKTLSLLSGISDV